MYACINYVTYLTQYVLHFSVKRFGFSKITSKAEDIFNTFEHILHLSFI